MSSRCGLLCLLAIVYALGWALSPIELRAEQNDRGPQGNQQITQLANGLAATTRAQVDQGGLRVHTDVPIPVPGVSETRTDLVPDNRTRPPTSIPGATGRGSVPPIDIPPSEITTQFPSGGANQIVGGGPLSCETTVGVASRCFGGTSAGGFDFVTTAPDITAPGGQTTAWRAVTRVVQLDPRALALNVEHELGFPPIVLKVNPDPGLAQLESWFWVRNYHGEVRTQSGTDSETHTECRLNDGNLECRPVTNSITVDLRETPTRYAWDFGDDRTGQDGHPAAFTTSDGLGRAYTDPYTSSSVQHKYVQSSLKFFDAGGFPIALHITWAAAFRINGGDWQSLDPVTGTFESRHQVRESWPVGVNTTTVTTHVVP
jgi:hypothetical protein